MATVPHVASGDIITSTAWNNMADEINLKATTADMNTRVSKAGDIMTGPLRINNALITTGSISANSFSALDPATNLPYRDNSINMANNIEGGTKWLHIGGITDTDSVRRIALYANRTFVSGNLGIGVTNPTNSLEVNGGIKSQNLILSTAGNTGNSMSMSRSDTNLQMTLGNDGLLLRDQPGSIYRFQVGHTVRILVVGGGTAQNFVEKFGIDQSGDGKFAGSLTVGGSDIYFTKTNHIHTGIGNTVGFAAIENSIGEYNALMILGRMLSTGRRFVQMWDDVDVKGRLRPSAGGGETAGIIFPLDAFGGTGDRASIQYISRGGEATSLEIKNLNDVDDNIEIKASGQVIITNSFSPSDERLKENIEPLKYGLAQIKKLFPVSYDWKNKLNHKKSIGLLAQNVETVINEAIYENKKDADNSELCLSYNYLIPVLINAIKELDQKLEQVQLKFAQ